MKNGGSVSIWLQVSFLMLSGKLSKPPGLQLARDLYEFSKEVKKTHKNTWLFLNLEVVVHGEYRGSVIKLGCGQSPSCTT